MVVSGQRRYAVPICTAEAPSANAARMPRPSAMPPAAITGTRTASTTCGTSANVPTCSEASAVEEHAAVAAGLGTLRDDRVAAVLGEPHRLAHRRRRADHACAGRAARARAAALAGSPKWKLTTSGRTRSTTAHAASSNGRRTGVDTVVLGSSPTSA